MNNKPIPEYFKHYLNENKTYYLAIDHQIFPGLHKFVLNNGTIHTTLSNGLTSLGNLSELDCKMLGDCSFTPFAAVKRLISRSYGYELARFYSYEGCAEKISTPEDIKKHKYYLKFYCGLYAHEVNIFEGHEKHAGKLYDTPEEAACHAYYVVLQDIVIESWNRRNPKELIII